MDSVVSAFRCPDCIGATRVACTGSDGIVSTLAVGMADRVNGREINDIETHFGDFGQSCDAVSERAVSSGYLSLAAGDHFIPSTVTRPRAIYYQWKSGRAGQVGAKLTFRHRLLKIVGKKRSRFSSLQKSF